MATPAAGDDRAAAATQAREAMAVVVQAEPGLRVAASAAKVVAALAATWAEGWEMARGDKAVQAVVSSATARRVAAAAVAKDVAAEVAVVAGERAVAVTVQEGAELAGEVAGVMANRGAAAGVVDPEGAAAVDVAAAMVAVDVAVMAGESVVVVRERAAAG